ncbi:hypothetical protein ACFL2J_07790, partial [Candidatus Omnitrophota bacterium]
MRLKFSSLRVNRFDIFDLLFIAFVLCVLISNIIWFKTDNSIDGVDSQNHLLFSMEFFNDFSSVIHSDITMLTKVSSLIRAIRVSPGSDPYWPPGLSLTSFLFYSSLGKSLFAAKVSILPYLFILLFSTYCLGKHIGSGLSGLTATFLIFFYPIIFQSSRQYQLDLPLTAMVVLSVFFLLKSNQF